MKVGFMTYDSKISFYNLNKGFSQPQQLNVGDVEDMFVPLVEGSDHKFMLFVTRF